jgi:hypothetical protein
VAIEKTFKYDEDGCLVQISKTEIKFDWEKKVEHKIDDFKFWMGKTIIEP